MRGLGVLLIVVGLSLCGSMAWLIHFLDESLRHPNGRGMHWTGGSDFTRTTFSLFYSLFGFGVVAVLGGTFQIVTGRRSRGVAVLTVATLVPVVWFVVRILSMSPA